MTWIKLDDKCPRHPKVSGLSDRAFRWWVVAMCYASEFLTDGYLPPAFIRTVPGKVRDDLVTAGLWVPEDGSARIHDYLAHQNSRDYVEGEKQFEQRRAAMRRNPELRAAIQSRDGDHCRYCGHVVSWTDRRSPRGATYDHIVPRGPETLENLVVCCRDCNCRKGKRTPEEAGMVLLEPRFRPRSDQKNQGADQNQIQTQKQIQKTDTETPPKDGGGARTTPVRFVSPAAWDRQHGKHVAGFCDWVCFPELVFDDCVRRLLGSGALEPDARASVRAWAESVRARWTQEGRVPGDDIFAFWRNEWQATHGSNKPSSGGSVDPLAGVREAIRRG